MMSEEFQLVADDEVAEETGEDAKEKTEKPARSLPPHVAEAVERVRKARIELASATKAVRDLGFRGLTSPVRKRKQKIAAAKREAARRVEAEAKRLKKEREAEEKRLAAEQKSVARMLKAAREAEEADLEASRFAVIEDILTEYYASVHLADASAHEMRNLAGVSHD